MGDPKARLQEDWVRIVRGWAYWVKYEKDGFILDELTQMAFQSFPAITSFELQAKRFYFKSWECIESLSLEQRVTLIEKLKEFKLLQKLYWIDDHNADNFDFIKARIDSLAEKKHTSFFSAKAYMGGYRSIFISPMTQKTAIEKNTKLQPSTVVSQSNTIVPGPK